MNAPSASPLHTDTDAKLPAAAYLRYEARADGWSAGRQAAFLSHLADNGVVADATRSVGMSQGGGYSLRRQARGYAFNLGWEAALIIARRIVADDLMTAAIKGEQSRWVREDGVTTFTRQNTKLSLTLLDRINPATTVPEVMAVATRFDLFLQLIDDGVSAQEMWDYFFDKALPREEVPARARVRAALLLCEETEDFVGEEAQDGWDRDDVGDAPMEYKSMHGPAQDSGSVAPHILPFPRLEIPPMAHLWLISISNHSNPNAAAFGPLRGLKACPRIRPNGCGSTISMLTSRHIKPSQSLGQKLRQRNRFRPQPVKLPCPMNLLAV